MYTYAIVGEAVTPIPVTNGDEGPGFYLENGVIPVKGVLAVPVEKGGSFDLGVAELVFSENGEKETFFRKASNKVISAAKKGYAGEAIVYVPDEGQLHSAMFCEKLVSGPHGSRVVREYLDIEKAEGLVIEDLGEFGRFARMQPNSSFRIHKDEHHTKLVVSWTGKELKVFRPKQAGGGTSRNRRRNRRKGERAFAQIKEVLAAK